MTDTVLLCHFEGTDGSTTCTDECGHTFTAGGSASIQVEQYKFGSSSGYFNATNSRFYTPDAPELELGNKDFTIEGWIRLSTQGQTSTIIAKRAASGKLSWAVQCATTNKIRFFASDDGTTTDEDASGATTVTVDTWHHFAVCRQGQSLKIFLDGAQDYSNATQFTAGFTCFNTTENLEIGGDSFNTGYYFRGYIDELRVTIGEALYTGAFTAPTAAYNTIYALAAEDMTDDDPLAATDLQSVIDSFTENDGLVWGVGAFVVESFICIEGPGALGHVFEDATFNDEQVFRRTTLNTAADDLTLNDAYTEVPSKNLREGFGLGETFLGLGKVSSTLADQAAFSETTIIAFTLALADTVTLNDTPSRTPRITGLVADSGGFVSAVIGNRKAPVLIASRVGLDDVLDRGFDSSADDGLTLDDTVAQRGTLVGLVVDTSALDDTTARILRVAAGLEEGAGLADTLAGTQKLVVIVLEGLTLAELGLPPDAVARALVVNSESGSLSEYDNYPFNSMAGLGTTYLGATETGIYELEGGDDAGVSISARFATGLMTLGTMMAKALPVVYLGYTSSGQLTIKVVTTDNGRKEEHWYRLRESKTSADAARVKVGKGLSSMFWGLEVENIEGAAFDISTLQVHAVPVGRRT